MNIRTILILSTLILSTSLFATTFAPQVEHPKILLKFNSVSAMVHYGERISNMISKGEYAKVCQMPIDVDYAFFPEGTLRIESKESYIFATKLAYAVSYNKFSEQGDKKQQEAYLQHARDYAIEYLNEFLTVQFQNVIDAKRLREHLFDASCFAGNQLLNLTHLYCIELNCRQLNKQKRDQIPSMIQESLSHYEMAIKQSIPDESDLSEIYFNIITQYEQLAQFPGQDINSCLSKAEETLLLLKGTNQNGSYLSAKKSVSTIRNFRKDSGFQDEQKALKHIELSADLNQHRVSRSPTEIFYNKHRMLFLSVKSAFHDMAQTKKSSARLLLNNADAKESEPCSINPIITDILRMEDDIRQSLNTTKRGNVDNTTSALHPIYAQYHENVGEYNFITAVFTYITYFHAHNQIEQAHNRSRVLLSVLGEKCKSPLYIFLARTLCAISEKKLGNEDRFITLQEEETKKQKALEKKRAKNQEHKRKQREKKREERSVAHQPTTTPTSEASSMRLIESAVSINKQPIHVETVTVNIGSFVPTIPTAPASPTGIKQSHNNDTLRLSVHSIIRDFCAPPGLNGTGTTDSLFNDDVIQMMLDTLDL